MLVDKAYHH